MTNANVSNFFQFFCLITVQPFIFISISILMQELVTFQYIYKYIIETSKKEILIILFQRLRKLIGNFYFRR